jgi:PAS domain S-box-containing protein
MIDAPVLPPKYLPTFLKFLLAYALIIFLLFQVVGESNQSLHLLIDTGNALLSLLLALFLLHEQYNIEKHIRQYLVIAFSFSAGTEILHALVGIEWGGSLAWIDTYTHILRPATWPPSTYVLPLALGWAYWLQQKKIMLRASLFAGGMLLLTLLLFALSWMLPRYMDTGILGIQRPTQILLLFLWLPVIAAYWRARAVHPLYEGFVWLGIMLFLSDAFMLYSTSPHEKFALIAHLGKFLAYMLLHLVQMQIVVADGIARSAAEQALTDEKNKVNAALEALKHQKYALDQHSIVSIADTKGTITYANDLFCNISGYSCEELLGKNHRILNSATHPTEFFREMLRTISAGKSWQGDVCNRTKQGGLYWVKTTIVPFIDMSSGKVSEYISIRTDITAQKSIQQEQLRLLAIVDAAPQFIGTATAQGSATHLNPAGRKMMGFTPDEDIRSTNIADYHPQWSGQIVLEQALPTAVRNGMWVGQTALISRNGEEIPLIQTILCHKNSDGSIAQFSTIASDMRQLNQVEKEAQLLREQIVQATKMESVGHLTAGIAHDFNNILGAMLGYAELSKAMLGMPQPIPTERIDKYLDVILSSGARAKELILQMLTFSRTSQTEGEQKNIPVIELAPLVKEVTSLLRSSIASTIDINYLIENEALKARIQPIQLHQVLLNLGVNARDAMGEYGRLDISLGEYHCEHQVCASCKKSFSGDFIKITVKDNGSGIPQKILNNIFDPFFTTKGVGKGTGMGLSVVHGLAHGSQGHVQVETSEKNGTEISILLPRSEGVLLAEENLKVEKLHAENIQGVRILIVDDELSLASMTSEFLKMHGAIVSTFTDSKLALAAFSENPNNFDLVITDETMPGLSGMHLAEKLLKHRPDLPIILCTGHSSHATSETVATAGIAGFFHKPYNMNALLQKIEQILVKHV